MARKSATKVKAMKNQNSSKFLKQPELPPIEETFNNIKQVMINTAKVQIQVANRVENMANLRLATYKFWGNMLDEKFISSERVEYFKSLVTMTVSVYEDILDIVKTFELDEFLKEEMKDYFEKLMPKVDDIKNEENLFEATLIADCVKPWGEKMTQLHHQMLDEQAQRKAIEADPDNDIEDYID